MYILVILIIKLKKTSSTYYVTFLLNNENVFSNLILKDYCKYNYIKSNLNK